MAPRSLADRLRAYDAFVAPRISRAEGVYYCTQPKIGSRFGLDSVPNRDVEKSSFGREEYETVSGRKEGSIRDAFSGDSCSYQGCFEGEWLEMSNRA